MKQSMNILLIDDDAACLEGLAEILEPAGYQCALYDSPCSAVLAYGEHYDVVITDLSMPSMNGIEVMQAILNKNQQAKVIIVTGHVPHPVAAGEYKGAYACMDKPIHIEKLMKYLEDIEKT
jgi:DNA-binding NtrC family response regulator